MAIKQFRKGERVLVSVGAEASSALVHRVKGKENKAVIKLSRDGELYTVPMNKLRKNGKVFIIESVGEEKTVYDMSEGRLLVEFLKIIGCEPIYHFIRTKKELRFFLAKAAQSSADYIHLACHGKTTYLRLVLEEITVDELVECAGDLTGKVVFSSACLTGRQSFGKVFVEQTGSRAFIGPFNEITWGDAAIITQLFYKKVFGEGVSPLAAFRYIKKVYPDNAGLKYFSQTKNV